MSQNNLYLLYPGSGNNAPDLGFPWLDPAGSYTLLIAWLAHIDPGLWISSYQGENVKGWDVFLAFPWVLMHSLSPKRPLSPYFPLVNIPTQLVVNNKGELVWQRFSLLGISWFTAVILLFSNVSLFEKITNTSIQFFMSSCWRKSQVNTLQMAASFL